MITNYFSQLKTNRFFYLFVGSLLLTACGSYQNSSYYDNDGVYGADTEDVTYRQQNETVVVQDNKYAQQFRDMQSQYPTDGEIFTNVDNYNSTRDTVHNQDQVTRYAGWGQNQTGNVSVNIYNSSPYWGWGGYYRPWGYYSSWGWGWNNGWYDPYWGWNSWYGGYYGGAWGWGWNSWYGGYYGPYGYGGYGGYYPYYGGYGWYGRNVVRNNGGRGSYNNFNNGNYSTGRQSGIGRTNNSLGTPRTNTFGTPRTVNPNNNTQPRNYNAQPRDYNTPRINTQPREQSPRTYDTPRPRYESSQPRTNNYSTPRSSDFGGGRGGNFGGGGGSFGGGRSGGGGGGRRG